jgi:hypothetical protein
MGLDMYLSKKTYVKKWSHQTKEETFDVSIKKGGEDFTGINPERVSYITEEISYWRKANQIHGWFCNNTEEVVPDVKYYVTKENLEELLDTCKKVLEVLNSSPKSIKQVVGGWKDGKDYMVDVEVYDKTDVILELLPPTRGFFFGSDDIDDWYKEQVEHTIQVIEEELNTNVDNYPEYEYYASW